MLLESTARANPADAAVRAGLVRRSILYLRQAAGMRFKRTAPCGGSWRAVCEDLASFNESAGKFFEPMGERLIGLQSRSREIARRTTAIADLLSQDDRSLTVLDEVVQGADSSHKRGEILAAMQAIQTNAAAVREAIQEVVRIVNNFDVLGMMTRIESSRFEAGGGAFGSLAEAVSALSRQVRQKIGATAESAALLLQTCRQSGKELRLVEQTRQQNLGPLTHQTSLGISTIRDHRNKVSHANTSLASRFGAVGNAVGDIVTAMQFHDIVRQQLEHISDTLGLLDRPDSSVDLGGTLRLQRAQLQNSHSLFQRSVEQMRQALTRIEANIGDVAAESGRLLRTSDGGDSSFFATVGEDLANIAAILERNVAADRNLAEAAVSVHKQLSEMTDTIAGVQAIGIEMQRTALNATIQAAHLGEAGGPLEVVAQAIQGLAHDSEMASGRIEDLLDKIRTAVMSLERAAGDFRESEQWIAQLRNSTTKLTEVQGQANDEYGTAVALIGDMEQQIRETIVMFRAADECVETLARAHRKLGSICLNFQPVGGPSGDLVAAVYTMESERTVHQSLVDATPTAHDLPLATEPVAADDDNVEFF